MINLAASVIVRTAPMNTSLASGAIEEGAALLQFLEANDVVVKISDGGTTLDFAGIAVSERTAPALFPVVTDPLTVVALPGSVHGVDIGRIPAQVGRVTYADGTALTLGATSTPGNYAVSGSQILVNVADLAKRLVITYTFVPTIQDIIALGGDNTPTTVGSMVSALKGVTVVKAAEKLLTSFFDATVNWGAWVPGTGLKAAANGMITIGSGTGVTIPGGKVVHAPTADEPFLGIAFNVA